MITHERGEELDEKCEERNNAKLSEQSTALAVCKRPFSQSAENVDDVEVKRSRLGLYNGNEAENNSNFESQVIELLVTPSVGITGERPILERENEGETNCPVEGTESKVSAPSNPKGASMTGFIRLVAEVAEDRGSRHTMEDTWVLLPDACQGSPGRRRCAHFAIYDGHGGRHAAEWTLKA